jgi:hypothetical protein
MRVKAPKREIEYECNKFLGFFSPFFLLHWKYAFSSRSMPMDQNILFSGLPSRRTGA